MSAAGACRNTLTRIALFLGRRYPAAGKLGIRHALKVVDALPDAGGGQEPGGEEGGRGQGARVEKGAGSGSCVSVVSHVCVSVVSHACVVVMYRPYRPYWHIFAANLPTSFIQKCNYWKKPE